MQRYIVRTDGTTTDITKGLADSLDLKTYSIVQISLEHEQVHRKNMHTSSVLFGGVDNDDYARVLFSGVENYETHVTFNFSADGKVYWCLYENPTFSSKGTLISGVNMHREGSDSTHLSVYKAPTVTTSGHALVSGVGIGGTKNFSIGGEVRRNTEWVFAPDKAYLVCMINKKGDASDISIITEYYEVEE